MAQEKEKVPPPPDNPGSKPPLYAGPLHHGGSMIHTPEEVRKAQLLKKVEEEQGY